MVDVACLRRAWHTWLQLDPRKLELAALHRDVEALVQTMPTNPKALRLKTGETDMLLDIAHTLEQFLKNEVSVVLKRKCNNDLAISTPFAGGAPTNHRKPVGVGQVDRAGGRLVIGTLNPGRTGLTALGTNQLLDWRLQAIGCALEDLDVHVCALPGARFPPGARLPEDFAFGWFGTQTLDWASVGILVRTEIMHACEILSNMGTDRIIWLRIKLETTVLFLCALYAEPGGDTNT